MKDQEKHIIEKFLEFEMKNNLFSKEIDGILFWHLIRFHVYENIQKKVYGTGQVHDDLSDRSLFQRYKLKFKNIPYMIFKNPLQIRNKDILVFNHNRRVKNGYKYDCLYTDLLLSSLKHSYAVVERPYLESHLRPITTRNISYTDIFDAYVPIKKKLLRIIKKDFFDCTNIIQELINKINIVFGIELDNPYWINYVNNRIWNFIIYKKLYKRLLTRTNPKIIIEVVSYDIQRFALNSAAKELNIPVIELQHGTMGKYHIAYNFLEKFELKTFPNYIFTFGQFWKDNTRFPIESDDVKVVGWPYYEQKVKSFRKIKKSNGYKVIIFISQGQIGKELSKLAVELSKKTGRDQYHIIYKLHPGEYLRWRNEYSWLLNCDIEVIDNNDHDMHYYFSKSDIQVGVSSTALFEGIGYGLKTIVVKFPGYEYMEELYNNSLAYLVSNTDEVMKAVDSNLESVGSNTEYFWKADSIQNFKNELEDIMDKSVEI